MVPADLAARVESPAEGKTEGVAEASRRAKECSERMMRKTQEG